MSKCFFGLIAKRVYSALSMLLILLHLFGCSARKFSDTAQEMINAKRKSAIVFQPQVYLLSGAQKYQYNDVTFNWRRLGRHEGSVEFKPEDLFYYKVDPTFLNKATNEMIAYDGLEAILVEPGEYALSVVYGQRKLPTRIVGAWASPVVTYDNAMIWSNHGITRYRALDFGIGVHTISETITEHMHLMLNNEIHITVPPGKVIYLGNMHFYLDPQGQARFIVYNDFSMVQSKGQFMFPKAIQNFAIYQDHKYPYGVLKALQRAKINALLKPQYSTSSYVSK